MKKFCIIDLEFCVIPKSRRLVKGIANEIIELGAVIMDENFNVISTYSSYVRPSFGGILNRYIRDLTGISHSDLCNAPDAYEVIGNLISMIDDSTAIVTWGDCDTRVIDDELFLDYYSTGRDDIPEWFYDALDDYIDCQMIFSDIMETKKLYSLYEALVISDVKIDGRLHTAFADASNTATLFKKTQVEEEFVFSPYFLPAAV